MGAPPAPLPTTTTSTSEKDMSGSAFPGFAAVVVVMVPGGIDAPAPALAEADQLPATAGAVAAVHRIAEEPLHGEPDEHRPVVLLARAGGGALELGEERILDLGSERGERLVVLRPGPSHQHLRAADEIVANVAERGRGQRAIDVLGDAQIDGARLLVAGA